MPAGDGLVDDLLPRCTFPPAGSTVSCAFSGGADSSALLVLAARAGCHVTAIHVDHRLRPTSGAEADHAEQLADRIGVPFERRTVDVAVGPNLEARARAARTSALPADVLTGHTADDQAETMLLNLLRGAGLDGLAGMDPRARPLRSIARSVGVRHAFPFTVTTPSLSSQVANDRSDSPASSFSRENSSQPWSLCALAIIASASATGTHTAPSSSYLAPSPAK